MRPLTTSPSLQPSNSYLPQQVGPWQGAGGRPVTLAPAPQVSMGLEPKEAPPPYAGLNAFDGRASSGALIPSWACMPPCVAWPARLGQALMKKPHGIDRDFKAYPTVYNHPRPAPDLWAISDLHGDFDRFVALAGSHGLVTLDKEGDGHWTGKTQQLVILGDLIDKGPKNLEVLELVQRLEAEAVAAGGRVTTLLGNHEVEFLADPYNDKAKGPGGIFWDLEERNINSAFFASDKHPTGHWLRNLPFGARVGDWFFAHGGQTSGRSLQGLESMLEVALKTGGFNDTQVRGPNSLIRGRNWYGSDGVRGQEQARLLGVNHIAFGHDPDSISPRGKIVAFPAKGRSLFRIDVGMSKGIDDSKGEMLHITQTDKGERVTAAGPHGKERVLTPYDAL